MQIVLNSIEELKEIAALINVGNSVTTSVEQDKPEALKKDVKSATEKAKKDKAETKLEDKSKVVDKKDETPKVEAEVTGVDETTTEPPKDVEVNEENTDDKVNITKEMVREKFNQVVKSGKQKEAKALIENLGAKKLSDVKPEDYATLMKEAEALL
jgi:archaellum component FlaD/FlaE